MTELQPNPDPHAGQPVYFGGTPLQEADAAVILVHGRSTQAEDFLEQMSGLQRDGYALVAPQAAGFTWCPHRFYAPLESNEPYLTSALAALDRALSQVESVGIPPARILLAGFSQGACLALEYAVRFPSRFGGIAALSGGLYGPLDAPRPKHTLLEGTPVYMGCSDADPLIPKEYISGSALVLRGLGARVNLRWFAGLGHGVFPEEMEAIHRMMLEIDGN